MTEVNDYLITLVSGESICLRVDKGHPAEPVIGGKFHSDGVIYEVTAIHPGKNEHTFVTDMKVHDYV